MNSGFYGYGSALALSHIDERGEANDIRFRAGLSDDRDRHDRDRRSHC